MTLKSTEILRLFHQFKSFSTKPLDKTLRNKQQNQFISSYRGFASKNENIEKGETATTKATTTTSMNVNEETSNNNKSGTSSNAEKMQQMRQMMHQTSTEGDDKNNSHPWDKLWESEITPWDIGKPTPVLISELERLRGAGVDANQEENGETSVLRSFIPGCGAGYDLLTVAKHHEKLLSSLEKNNSQKSSSIDSIVIGLDISPTSIKKAKNAVQSLLDEGEELGGNSSNADDADDTNENKDGDSYTKIHFMHGDFFGSESKWSNASTIQYSSNSSNPSNSKKHEETVSGKNFPVKNFDFIFDYTFFCALPPELRSEWGKRMSTLLEPRSGKLLTLIFPIPPGNILPPTLEGPPFPVTIDDYKSVLEPHGLQMMEGNPYENEDTVKPRKGKEMVCWWEFSSVKRSSI
jgi:hypothetical protein